MNDKIKLDSIEDAIADFKEGKFLIVVDDEDRENEGDFIIAAEKITPEKVNFMLKHARGVLCAPITLQRCKELDLDVQVSDNTSMLGTPFTVTVDKLEGCSTGVSAHDRAATIRALADPNAKPADFGRPGHINPLYAQDKGVLRRTGHTEAAVDLARLAGLYPAGALMEIMNDDGTMARLPELKKISDEFGIKLISINDLVAYRLKQESIVEKGEEVDMPTKYGHFRLIPFLQKSNGLEHMAIVKGEWEKDEPILVRVHSSCATGDILGSYRCDCGAQLHKAMEMIEKEGKGVVVYLNQEGRGIGSFEKLELADYEGRTRAFLKIEDGCNRFCSYCIIPYARGRVRSKALADLKSEAQALAERGFREIVLVGINLTAFGQDTGLCIADAVEAVCAVDGIARVRLGSIEPDHLTPAILARLAAQRKLCPQFHLALQSGCDATLKRMNRHYTTAEYAALCDDLRAAFPQCAVTTDFMVGFPGETDEEFAASLAFVEKIGFSRVHIFAYSRRAGTPAAKAPAQVTNKVKAARSRQAAQV